MSSLSSIAATLAASLLVCLLGCHKESGQTQREPSVLMDSWWNVDYAKIGCEMREKTDTPCLGDPTPDVKDYEAQITTRFAADPTCHGIRLLGWGGNRSIEEDKAIDYQLMLDYIPGESKQSWTVTSRKTHDIVATGTDNAETTARTLCSVLTHKGGAVGE